MIPTVLVKEEPSQHLSVENEYFNLSIPSAKPTNLKQEDYTREVSIKDEPFDRNIKSEFCLAVA